MASATHVFVLHTFNTDDKLPTDLIVDILFYLLGRQCRSMSFKGRYEWSSASRTRLCTAG